MEGTDRKPFSMACASQATFSNLRSGESGCRRSIEIVEQLRMRLLDNKSTAKAWLLRSADC